MLDWESLEEFCEALCFAQQLTGSGKLNVHVVNPDLAGNIHDGRYTLSITKDRRMLLGVTFDQELDVSSLRFTINNQLGKLIIKKRIGEQVEVNSAGLVTSVSVKLSGFPLNRIKAILTENSEKLFL